MASDPPADWILSQKKVFTNWVNLHLSKRGLEVKDLQTDFSDGVLLCNLMEIISGKKLPTRWKTEAKNRLLKVQNLNIALQFIADEGIRLVGCGSEDICDGTLKLIMGLIWTLILRYQIQTGTFQMDGNKKMGAKEMLMNWVQKFTGEYNDVPVKDFHQSWQDGRAFCALVHRLAPEHIDMSKLSKDDKLGNLNLAFETANKVLGVPKLLDANDIAESSKPDEQSIMTYVSLFPQLYSDRGITVDPSSSANDSPKQGNDDAKKKEEEERRKKKEEEDRKKKEEEERKKKEDEDKKKLIVKAKSHGDVSKISALEEKLKQAEATIARLSDVAQKSTSENKGLQQEVLEKSTSMERLNAAYAAEIERLKTEGAKSSKLADDAEDRRAKLHNASEEIKKKEREEADERLRKAEERWQKEKEDMEARFKKEKDERDEREAKLRKEKEDSDAKWRQDKEESDAKSQKEKLEAEERFRKEKEGADKERLDEQERLRKEKEAGDAKSQKERQEAEEKARKEREDGEERLRKANEQAEKARRELEDKLQKEAEARKAAEDRLKKEDEENKERLRKLEEEKGKQGGESEDRIKELLKRLAETEGKLKKESEEVEKWKGENDGTNKKLQGVEKEKSEQEKENAQQKEALSDLTKRLEDAERRLRENKDKEGKDDEDRKKQDEEKRKQEDERRKQEAENAKKREEELEERLRKLEKENEDKLKALLDKAKQEEADSKKRQEELAEKLKQAQKENEDRLKELQDKQKEDAERQKREEELAEKLKKAEKENADRAQEAKAQAEKEEAERKKRDEEYAERLKKLEKENADKLKEMEDKLNALEKGRADAVAGGDEARKRLEEGNNERDKKLADLAALVRKLEEDKAKLEKKEEENNEKIKSLENSNSDKEKRLNELEERRKEIEAKAKQAEEENKENAKRVSALEAENGQKEKSIKDLQAQLSARGEQGEATDARIRELEELLKAEKANHANTQQQKEKFESEAKQAEENRKEEEKSRKEAEAKAAEEEKKRKEEEEKRQKEEAKRKEAEEKRKEEEEKRKEEEEKRKEEERKRKEAEDANEANAKKLKDANLENELLKKELERLRASLEGDKSQGAQIIQQLEEQLKEKSKDYDAEKDKREKSEKDIDEAKRLHEEERAAMLREVDNLRRAYEDAIREAERANSDGRNKHQGLEEELSQVLMAKDAAQNQLKAMLEELKKEKAEKEKLEHLKNQEKEKKEKAENESKEEKSRKEKAEKELEELKKELANKHKSSEDDNKKIKELLERIANLENNLKGSDKGFAQELDNKNARIKELESLLKQKEKENTNRAESQANDLRRALEQVQSFHDILSKQDDSVSSTKAELQQIEQELLYSNQSNAELVHEVKQLSKTIAALKAKFLHNISNLQINEYPQFSSGLFAAHSKVTVNFSLSKCNLNLSSGNCQFFDEQAHPITKHQEYAKFVSKSELHIDFSAVPDDVTCILTVLTLEGGVLVGGESVRSEIVVDFKKSEHADKIDLNTALDKRASIDKFDNSAAVPKRLIAIMFSKCEDDENTLWGTVKRFNISEGVWRVGSVGIFDCEKQNQNFAHLHKLVPIKRYGWIAYSDIQDIYSVIGHTDAMMTGKTHEIARLSQEIATFENTRKDLEKRLQEALKNQCTHGSGGDTKVTHEILIKYKFYMSSQLPFFGLFLLDTVTQQAVAAWARQLGDPAKADPFRSPRTARRDEDALRINAQAELAQVSDTEATFKGLMTNSSSNLIADAAQADEREQLGNQIGKLTSSLEALVGQVERDKALARAMKSSVQLQQFLAVEAESVVIESEKGSSEASGSGSGSSAGSGAGSGTGTTRKGMKKMMTQSPQELATLLDEFKQMEYIEDEDSIPQDTTPNSTIMVIHNIHHAAQQALFSGKISKSILQLTNSLPESGNAELQERIKREADRRNADMQGWVGEWVNNLGKLAQLVSARNASAGSASYANLQKEFEMLKNQHQEIKDKLDFLGNEQKATEEDDGPIPIEKAIPIISLDIEEEPMVIKNTPETPPPKTKKIIKSNTLSPSPSRKKPVSKTPPPTKVTSPTPASPHQAKTLPLKSPSSKLAAYVREKTAGPSTPPKSPAAKSTASPIAIKPSAAALEVDKHLAEVLSKMQITGPISKVGDCQYQIGSKKVTMQIISGYLVVRVGGGYMKFEEWILKFGRKEGIMIAGEPISGTGVAVLGAHGSITTKAMNK